MNEIHSFLYRPAPFVSLYVELRSMYHYLGIVQRADNELLFIFCDRKECFTHQLHFPFIIGKSGSEENLVSLCIKNVK